MAKLTLMELENVSTIIGNNGVEYAVFSASTVDNELVRCGITHNLIKNLGFQLDNLDSLIGCQVMTKVYTNNRTGELVNPEDQLQKVLDGESSIICLTAINATILKSDLFKIEQKEMIATTNAKAKVEKEKEAKAKAMAASLERLRARALAAAQQSMIDKAASLDDEEEETPTTPSTPAVVAEPEAELEF